jgi:hypothetical protein
VLEPERSDELLPGVRIDLLDEHGAVVRSTVTDVNGRFEFNGLRPGVYSLRETQPTGYFDGNSIRHDQSLRVGDSANLIAAIRLTSGQVLEEFAFCEDPPVEVLGYVFQDGPAIELAFGESPLANFAQIRDGRRTADDSALAGVVVELRVGQFGAPFSPEFALPGYYPDGRAVTVTDRNGFYRFSGLKKGTYAVYERQPGGYLDGLDTGGTTAEVRGLALGSPEAINQSDPLGELALLSMDSPPGFDVIRFIHLPPGTSSEENNFSEVVIQSAARPIFMFPFPLAEAEERTLASMIEPYEVTRRPLDASLAAKVSYGHMRGRGHTWHLSVIDGGTPRGEGETVNSHDSIWLVSSTNDRWTDRTGSSRANEWTLFYKNGETRQYYFGAEDAIPVSGDFNGDGVYEIGVFVQGHWFIDINGNGRWDDGDLWAKLGHRDDQPVTGDWDGDGKDDIGIFGRAWPGDPRAVRVEPGLPDHENAPTGEKKNLPPARDDASQGRRTLRLTAQGRTRIDLIDHVFHFGGAGDRAVAGDWNGDGVSTIGVFVGGRWRMDRDGDGRFTTADDEADFGRVGDIPIVGDFNGDGIDDIGVYRDGQFILDANGNRRIDAGDVIIHTDRRGRPVTGDWDGDGTDDVGIVSESIRFVEIEARVP